MLIKVSEEIAECYRRAEQARQAAKDTSDQSLKSDFFDLERRWLFLARSYEFTERLQHFTKSKPHRDMVCVTRQVSQKNMKNTKKMLRFGILRTNRVGFWHRTHVGAVSTPQHSPSHATFKPDR